ncbi:MAG: hypothetical protein HN368_15945 [Spirochaetales bacterium]|mgnify:CR=1 FL=1|jgi:hypothetical protein|nr:hypothetical protein [Spirochaetales bacterium]
MNAKANELVSIISERIDSLTSIYEELAQAYAEDIPALGQTSRSALIIAGLLENYYTCAETAWLRISQYFENNLDPEKWHTSLLEKMVLAIKDIRPAAVSKENYNHLLELMRFRDIKRYYFQIDYDWDKLKYLTALLHKAHPMVISDTEHFKSFLLQLLQE